MSVTAGQRRGRLRPVLAATLTLALLGPVGLLFVQTRQRSTDLLDRTRTERQAIEYLTRLTPLLSAVTEAQSTALRGRTGALAAVQIAVVGVVEIDQKLGPALGVRERWTTLRDKLDQLPAANNSLAALEAHVEAADLLLALYEAVRDNSGLARDPDSDIAHLQQAVAVDLPRTVILATRAADLSLLAPNVQGVEGQAVTSGLAAASAGAGAAVKDLTGALHRASDDTLSASLSSSVLGTLDAFRKAIESITQGVDAGQAINQAQLTAAYGQLQQGLTALGATVLTETDKLLVMRADAARAEERDQLLIVGAAVLTALLLLLVLLVPARGRAGLAPSGTDAERRWAEAHEDLGPSRGTGEFATERRERSGALR